MFRYFRKHDRATNRSMVTEGCRTIGVVDVGKPHTAQIDGVPIGFGFDLRPLVRPGERIVHSLGSHQSRAPQSQRTSAAGRDNRRTRA